METSDTHFIDKEHTRDKLCDALLDVAIYDLVDFTPELVGDLCPPTLDELTHDTHDILPTLRAGISHVKVMQGYVLYELFALVYVALWQRYIFLSLEVVL
jgi:hypothetical protein